MVMMMNYALFPYASLQMSQTYIVEWQSTEKSGKASCLQSVAKLVKGKCGKHIYRTPWANVSQNKESNNEYFTEYPDILKTRSSPRSAGKLHEYTQYPM